MWPPGPTLAATRRGHPAKPDTHCFGVADDGAVWAGEFPTFVKDPEAFDLCDGIGSSALEHRGFRELNVGDHDDFTLTFVGG
jgi:hypothetical protein